MIRIIITAEDHLMRQALEQIFRHTPDILPTAILHHTDLLLPTVRKNRTNLIILDLAPPGHLAPVLGEINATPNPPKILILSALRGGQAVVDVLRAGVSGYLLKDDLRTLELPEVVRSLVAGSPVYSEEIARLNFLERRNFTETELAVLRLAAQGYANAQIAVRLHLAEKTVRNTAHQIYRKLALEPTCNLRVAALEKARAMGLL